MIDDLKIFDASEVIKELKRRKKAILAYVHLKMEMHDYKEACDGLNDIRMIDKQIEVWKNFEGNNPF